MKMKIAICRRRIFDFSRFAGIVFIASLFFMAIYVRVFFNMKGYFITNLPQSILAIYERFVPSHAIADYSAKINSKPIHTHKMNNLYNLPTIIKTINKNSTDTRFHNILLYNKPSWIREDGINGVLRSDKCVYDNCRLSTDITLLMNSTAVIFWFEELDFYPPVSQIKRQKDQVWVFFGLEPPPYYRWFAYRHSAWQNTMNWSMTYRLDSDIPVTYGYLETLLFIPTKNYTSIYGSKTRFAAWIVSRCGAMSFRDEYVKEMENEGIKVDIYGRCGWDAHHSDQNLDQMLNRDYMFYLSFENSLCRDYITEKLFRKLALDVVPIVRGGADNHKLLPNDTFINAADFESAKELVAYMKHVSGNEDNYVAFLRNSDKFIHLSDSINDNTYTWCHLCEKLNNLEKHRKTYRDMATFLADNGCVIAKDISVTWFFKVPCMLIVIVIVLIYGIRKCCYGWRHNWCAVRRI